MRLSKITSLWICLAPVYRKKSGRGRLERSDWIGQYVINLRSSPNVIPPQRCSNLQISIAIDQPSDLQNSTGTTTVTSAMYVFAVLLTPVAVVLLILLLLWVVQPRAPIIIVHLHCTCSRLVQEEPDDEQGGDDEQDEDYWHTPVQETQRPQ